MKRSVLIGTLVSMLAASSAFAQPSRTASGNTSLGSVTLAKKVMADGKPLAAGTYQIRVTNDEPKPGVGQSPGAEKYVEFVRGGKVVAREVATVIPANEIKQVAKTSPPKPGQAKVELLKGGEYYRVWINRGGNNYLINLPVSA